jgi:ABC-2 type transport system ATP-binding protein
VLRSGLRSARGATVGDVTDDVVRVHGLVKDFGSHRALDGLDLDVRRGEVHGFLGPNGAGKSTTLRILLGLLRRTAGEVTVLGADPWRDVASLHRRLSYVPGDVTLWPQLTGGEVIDLLCRLRGGVAESRRDALLRRFDLDPTKRSRTYSKGNRQKVALVAALASEPETTPLLVLDEPTSGLDPLVEETFREVVADERRAGRSVLLSSHVLSEVEALCDRVSIVNAGRTIETGTLAQMRHLTDTSVDAVVAGPPPLLGDVEGVHGLRVDGQRVRAQVPSPRLGEVLARLGTAGIVSLVSRPPTLEELFLRHYDGAPATRREESRTP